MPEKLNAILIEQINRATPEHTTPASLVADVLQIGREAAYRRLRGEVLFTFDEAAKLTARIGLSLDSMIGSAGGGGVVFQLNQTGFYSTLEQYNEILLKEIAFIKGLSSDKSMHYALVGSNMPPEFYMRYSTIARFKFFRWLYQHGLVTSAVRCFEQLRMPEPLESNYSAYVRSMESVASACYVFDNNGFNHWVNALKAYRAMDLISVQSIRTIRDELLQLLDDMEAISVNGGYANGNKVSLYLSDIDLDSTFSYISTSTHKSCSLGIFALNTLRTTDEAMVEQVRLWIQSQTRFATLISGSGELQRLGYFNRQRELLMTLEKEGV